MKGKRDSDAPPEWRGGKLVTILDEGILNTENYERVRKYISQNYYIKAIISLTPDTFEPVSNTSTKTSIFYGIKKENSSDVQDEPIFYAHVNKVGLDTTGEACDNHLTDILDRFKEFKSSIIDSYQGKRFNESKFMETDIATKGTQKERDTMFYEEQSEDTNFYIAFPSDPESRLDYFFRSPKTWVLDNLKESLEMTQLESACEEKIVCGKRPEYDEEGEVMVIKTAEIMNSHIDYDSTRRVSKEFYDDNPRAQIEKGDVLVTTTGLGSLGRVDVYDQDKKAVVNGKVSVIKTNDEYDPYFIAFFLRSYYGQLQFEKWFNGSSGQIELQPEDLERFLIPSSEEFDLEQQKSMAETIQSDYEDALEMRRKAEEKLSNLRFEIENKLDL